MINLRNLQRLSHDACSVFKPYDEDEFICDFCKNLNPQIKTKCGIKFFFSTAFEISKLMPMTLMKLERLCFYK